MAALPDSELAKSEAAAEFPELITVEQYRKLPDDRSTVYELHLGEVAALSHPKPLDAFGGDALEVAQIF